MVDTPDTPRDGGMTPLRRSRVQETNMRKLYQNIALALEAIRNCEGSGNDEWRAKHTATVLQLVKEYMPSGSGIDNGTTIDFDASKPDKLIFHTSFHHMDDNGMYSGWTDHSVAVTPSLGHGIHVKITGRDRNEIKDYLADVFHSALEEEGE